MSNYLWYLFLSAVSVSVHHKLSKRILLANPDGSAKFLHIDILCDDTCFLSGWALSSFCTNPYRTPSVNQYWAIVNASFPCDIFCSLLLLEVRFFQAYINGAKVMLSTVRMPQSGGQTSTERETVGSIPSCTKPYFYTWPKSDHVKSDWTQVWQVKKSDMNQSMIQ